MAAAGSGRTARQAAGLVLDEATVDALRAQLPRVASVVVAEVMQQVPAYDVPFQGQMGKIIERAVQVSLASFVTQYVDERLRDRTSVEAAP